MFHVKRMVFILAVLFSSYSTAYGFSLLISEELRGSQRLCTYSNGKTITVNSMRQCPMRINT